MVDTKNIGNITGVILLHPLITTFILLSSYPINYNIPTPFWFIILASFILSVFFLLLRNWLTDDALLYILFFSDIPFIGIMIHFTGGIESLFPFFYVLLIILSSIYLFRRGAYIIALTTVMCFFLLSLLEARGTTYPMRFVMYRFYLFSLLFLFSAILSGWLSERYRRGTEEVKKLRLTTEDIIKNLPSEILTIDRYGDIIFSNINDKTIMSRVYPYLVRFLKSKNIAHSFEINLAKRRYILSCRTIHSDQIALSILQDITALRRLEESSYIAKQTKVLAELGASLAHELRNPLASIRGSLEVIKNANNITNILPFITMAIAESERLNGIVTDFLNFAQFTPIKKNRISISNIITETLLETKQRFSAKKIAIIRKDDDFYIMADLIKLKSGFVNILNNAYEASSDGKKIFIQTYKSDKEGYVEIVDQGKGIPPKNLKEVFTPFFTTKKGGTGLGLSIARRVIEAHNGKVEIDSKIGVGTTFKVILPLI